MFPVGGVEVMLIGAVVSLLVCLALAGAWTRSLGWVTGWSMGLLVWTLCVIAVVTLIPADGAPGIVPAEGRLAACSWDLGGPAPDGFWIFDSGQRLLNTVLFVPSGALLVVAAARWRQWAVLAVPVGLALLAAYSFGIEMVQLELARIDRACDVTDMVDNASGAVIGAGIGLLLALLLRPWRHRDAVRERVRF